MGTNERTGLIVLARRTRWVSLALFLACWIAAPLQATPEITIGTDRPDAVYAAAETAVFLVDVTNAGKPVARAELSGELSTDGFRHSERIDVKVTDGKARVKVSRDEPCILWIRLTMKLDDGTSARRVMGAAFSPERIRPSMPKPNDFDAFWQDQKARLDKIPMGVTLEKMDSDTQGVELYAITMNNIEKTQIYGYLAKPVGEGPFPAFLQVQWAGVYSLNPAWVLGPAKKGFISLNINAHAIENGQPKEFYQNLNAGRLRDYPRQGRESRDTSYFRRMYLSCYRAAEYLASRPEWDRRHFIVTGGSQGGGQTLVTAGLSPHVTALASNVPALCDLTGHAADRPDGWPKMVAISNETGRPDLDHQNTARYYDAVNFVYHVDVPAIVGTGFADLVCPSSSVYAAFNLLKGPKAMVLDPQTGHGGNKVNWAKAYETFLVEQGGLEDDDMSKQAG